MSPRTHPRLGARRRTVDCDPVFELFVVSNELASCALAQQARPRALRVSVVTRLDQVIQRLEEEYSLVDAEIEANQRDPIVRAIRERWHDVPGLPILRAASPQLLAFAEGIGDSVLFKSEGTARQQRMRRFMREALDGQLWRTARLIHQAGAHNVTRRAPYETFVALHVPGMPRHIAGVRKRLCVIPTSFDASSVDTNPVVPRGNVRSAAVL